MDDLIVQAVRFSLGMVTLKAPQVIKPVLTFPTLQVRIGQHQLNIGKVLQKSRAR
jgi:hypothetical protein